MLYDAGGYGRSFADVYDDWYRDLTDADATAARVGQLADGGIVLELGVGTGRLALPIARTATGCVGIDASPEMLARLVAKPDGHLVPCILGDMAALPLRPAFSVVLAAFNTLFNLADLDAIEACVHEAARVLSGGGALVVEAFVPPEPGEAPDDDVSVRDRTADHVVITAAHRNTADQTILGHHVEFTSRGLRLRPWRVCYATTAQLDRFAVGAGLTLEGRAGGWHGEPFDRSATTHVSVYRKPGAAAR